MKLFLAITAIALAGFLGFGYINNSRMHDSLAWRLTHDKKVIAETGRVVEYEFFESFSCDESGGDCSDTYWVFKVSGIRNCILVDAVTKEEFPFYSVTYVEPSHHFESLYSKDEVIYENKRVVSECPST